MRRGFCNRLVGGYRRRRVNIGLGFGLGDEAEPFAIAEPGDDGVDGI